MYILFHTPSVYNWLRDVPCKESALLASYVGQVKKKGVSTMSVKPAAEAILKSLEDYCRKWEVTKLTFTSTVYVNRVREQSCHHLGKTEQRVISLLVHPQNNGLCC